MKKRITFGVIGAMTLMLVAGCGGGSAASSSADSSSVAESSASSQAATGQNTGGGYTIGYSWSTLQQNFFTTEKDAFVAAAEADGSEVLVTDANSNIEKQISDLEDYVARGVDAIVVGCVDSSSLVSFVTTANNAGIPVFAQDRAVTPETPVVSSILVDSAATTYQVGIAMTEAFNEKYGDDAEIVCALLSGTMGNTTSQQRRTGFMAGVLHVRLGLEYDEAYERADEHNTELDTQGHFTDEDAKFSIVGQQYGDFTEEGGMNGMEDILTANRDVNMMFAENDAMGSGAVKAIAEFNMTGSVICGSMDNDENILALIAADDGTYCASGMNNPNILGELSYNTVKAYLGGEEVDKVIYMEAQAITKDNIADYYPEYA